MFKTNVTGLINMTQAILPIFQARGESGAGDIINVGSIAGREPYPGGSIYCATKAAVRSFTDALRKELIATRIRVIEVDPGQVETEFSVVRFYGDKAAADKVYEGCEPLTPDDIAEVVVFAAGRRENVVLADSLIFPNHQVSLLFSILLAFWLLIVFGRPLPRLCTERVRRKSSHCVNDLLFGSNVENLGRRWRQQLVQASSTQDLDMTTNGMQEVIPKPILQSEKCLMRVTLLMTRLIRDKLYVDLACTSKFMTGPCSYLLKWFANNTPSSSVTKGKDVVEANLGHFETRQICLGAFRTFFSTIRALASLQPRLLFYTTCPTHIRRSRPFK
ncbi:unnamed protein product [Aureobasidium pullulans]|nr:unnamed protein product [Aureobasidium pullulans]